MFSSFFLRLCRLLRLRCLSRQEAYLAGAVDLAQLECRMRALDRLLDA